MPRAFLIDTDTASDDAVALIMALRHPDIQVQAITIVSGNVPIAQAARNALYTVELCGADIPVFMGAARPILRAPAHADWFHGKDGLGDMNLPPPRLNAQKEHAIDAIIDHVHRTDGIELVTLGPLTNIALAIQRDPSIARRIARCVVMGGNPCCVGNVTPAAEYNIWCDPEAAAIVMRSGLKIELIGWQLCRADANLRADDISSIRALDNPIAHFAIDCNRVAMEANRKQSGEEGIALPDPVAMSVAIEPAIALESSQHRIEIECHSELTRGQTVIDQLDVGGDDRNRGLWSSQAATGHGESFGRGRVVWKIDVPRWKQLLIQSLR